MNDMNEARVGKDRTEMGSGHSLAATDRRDITVKGVSEVLSFDETLVRLVTACGVLNLEGEGLRVCALDLGAGLVSVTGRLNGVLYEDAPAEAPAPRGKTRSRGLFR